GFSFRCSVAVGIHGKLEHPAVGKLQFLKKPGSRTVLGTHGRGGYFVAGLQAAAVFPAHSRPAECASTAEFESPLLSFAVGILDVYGQVGMRINPLHFGHSSGNRKRLVNVELRLNGMMRGHGSS